MKTSTAEGMEAWKCLGDTIGLVTDGAGEGSVNVGVHLFSRETIQPEEI